MEATKSGVILGDVVLLVWAGGDGPRVEQEMFDERVSKYYINQHIHLIKLGSDLEFRIVQRRAGRKRAVLKILLLFGS